MNPEHNLEKKRFNALFDKLDYINYQLHCNKVVINEVLSTTCDVHTEITNHIKEMRELIYIRDMNDIELIQISKEILEISSSDVHKPHIQRRVKRLVDRKEELKNDSNEKKQKILTLFNQINKKYRVSLHTKEAEIVRFINKDIVKLRYLDLLISDLIKGNIAP